MKRGDWCWYRSSSSEKSYVRFVGWVRKRMHTGGPNTNKIGVGAVMWSDWLFRRPFRHDKRVPAGFGVLRPYWTLYRPANKKTGHSAKVRVPPLSEVTCSVATLKLPTDKAMRSLKP